jgi:heme/copper-type cytochrome/quinol oxidase subunit 3
MLDIKPGHHTPPRTATIGMWLFLAALTMLFGATLLGYLIVRTSGQASPQLHTLHLPRLLYLSTALILFGSFTIHQAVAAVRRERQQLLRQYLVLTCVLAAAFVLVQAPALAELLREHAAWRSRGLGLYGLIFVLILVHALHVVGGIVGLTVTTTHALQGRYDHERYGGVKHAAMYWHFLDLVWLVMYTSLAIAG